MLAIVVFLLGIVLMAVGFSGTIDLEFGPAKIKTDDVGFGLIVLSLAFYLMIGKIVIGKK